MRIKALLFIGSIPLFTSCNLFGPKADDVKLGLKFASEIQMRAIPFASAPFSGKSLPTSVNLSDRLPPVGNQGDQNSCVGWSIGYALKSFQERVEGNQTLLFSPAFIYNQLNNGQDGGITILDAMLLVSHKGAALLSDMPYNPKDYTTKPTKEILEKASKYKIDIWHKVNVLDVKEVKAHVNAGYPVVIGTAVDEGFILDGKKLKQDYIWKSASGKKMGPHAMLVVGYDDSKNALKVMNSWGPQWGDNGFGWIDYDFFPTVVREGFVAKDAVNDDPDNPPAVRFDTIAKKKELPKTIDADTALTISQELQQKEIKGIRFDNIRVVHNQTDPKGIDGIGMLIMGRADIPAGYGKNFQIAIYINNESGTTPVASLMPDRYGDPSGNAATATDTYDVPANGLSNYRFKVFIPYAAMDVPMGYTQNGIYQPVTTNMLAKPFLYIDNYAVGEGEQTKFFVRR